jgi:hypothetical protein
MITVALDGLLYPSSEGVHQISNGSVFDDGLPFAFGIGDSLCIPFFTSREILDSFLQWYGRTCLDGDAIQFGVLHCSAADVQTHARIAKSHGHELVCNPVAADDGSMQYMRLDLEQILSTPQLPLRTWKVSVNFEVRGHWRKQAYGPGRAYRRLKWIASFRKGPET